MYNKIPLGVKGKFPEKTREQFSGEIGAYYQHSVSLAPGGKKLVNSAALISGGAHKEITQAVDAGVDCYVTGSFDEPIWNIAFEEQINFLAVGHSASEKIGVKALGDHLERQFGLQHTFLDVFNPF
jgi:putative NIF3 family GTP cyclohydrolase 1 type 2